MNRLHSGRWVELTDPWVRINFDASAFVAKAMACLQVVHLELFLGLREVEIEGDSRSVIQKLLGMVTSGVVEAMVVDRRWIDSVGD